MFWHSTVGVIFRGNGEVRTYSVATEHFSIVSGPNVTRNPFYYGTVCSPEIGYIFRLGITKNAADKAPAVMQSTGGQVYIHDGSCAGGTVCFAVHTLRSLMLSVFGLLR
jgi:hypothetical protein